ncbi:DNA-binding protein (plasmid) [Dyella sp. BiH032]|uniref:DNA-binding protein n=1 Tax=Dyella sp. BiH032 TaxID=3075430 RepID=UPI0028934F3F|nr:DNA-binding protein [Dyella sp. BiH032]WNL48527.1 DNA-binding protein [Dyella sp. BiH032]
MRQLNVIANPSAVREAADAILAAGKNPTVEAVRARLGGGSPNTIVRELNAWREALGERFLALEQRPPLPAPLGEMVKDLWTVALTHARAGVVDELAAERSSIEGARLLLEADRQELEKTSQARALEVAELRGRLELTDRARIDAEQRLQQVTGERDAALMEAGTIAAHRKALEAELSRTRAEREGDRQWFDAEQQRLLREVDAQRQSAKDSARSVKRLEDAAARAAEKHAGELARVRDRLQTAEERRSELVGRVKELERQNRVRRASPTSKSSSKRKATPKRK